MRRLFRLLAGAFAALTLCAAGAWAAEDLPELRWGGDSEGNVPYMFGDPENQERMIGFEVDLVEALCRQMGRRPVFVSNGWDNLIPGLNLKLYDMALSGLEITAEHRQAVDFSLPYYKTFLQLVVPRGNPKKIADLGSCVGQTVGTLKQSYAYDTLVDAGVTDIRTYENEINAYQDMANGRLDAVLMDSPIAIFYAGFNPNLEFVGEPIGSMEYGIAVRQGDSALKNELNAALTALRESGQLRDIYEKWNMWTPVMADFFDDHSPARVGHDGFDRWASFQKEGLGWKARFDRYVSFLPVFGRAALVTLQVSLAAMALAIVLGMVLAVARLFGPRWLSALAVGYIELLRGTPVLIQLFFIFYGLPNVGIKLSPFAAGIIGLGMNYAAYEAENYRAGLMAVPRQQMEGALALGMTRSQALRHVVVPQAIRVSLPPVTNDFISLLKDSSLVSMITLIDLTKAYGQLANTYYDFFGIGIMVALIYFLIGLPFVRLARFAERRLAVAVKGRTARGVKETIKAASYHN
ncbi:MULTISPECIES: ABC transporter substrate-binding protein/permease [Jonquetella]|uniref:Amine acid ABC transporter, permease protein, 3-TM region, His/Glu/Gln/Arg/opine family n=1 Tax=Jonquetella anthropi DSM 22815 TaxID=885272 RepID=H0UJ00_9BACT|nr:MULTISPECIES: ABC transporter substrate-binding protein/permease [Jonquetella]EHM13827.1 amine acid ABC transporter, permease protein, 3-TM region, His/Glu/Gln/Arg/opine family [Jonquetella anthropi DSM 22815]ERL23746.1 ABC transporter, permease protein [Jonquetella sp. BV3C21]